MPERSFFMDFNAYRKDYSRHVGEGLSFSGRKHNPLNPLTRLVVSRCEFDRDAVLLTAKAAKRLLRGSA